MKIVETLYFDDTEQQVIDRAMRWATIGIERFGSGSEELKAVGQLKRGNSGGLTREKLHESYTAWNLILIEMLARISVQQDIQAGNVRFSGNLKPGTVPLIADPIALAKGMEENLQAGVEEVREMLRVVNAAIKAMKCEPLKTE